MNNSLTAVINRTQVILDALRRLSDLPAAEAWYMTSEKLDAGMMQFFPHAGHTRKGNYDEAKIFARVLGGDWTRDADMWESTNITFPGLEGVKIVLHYVEPKKDAHSPFIDIGEPVAAKPDRDEPDYAPKPLTPMENSLRNDEHRVA